MEIRVLKYFLAVAQEENITRARRRAHAFDGGMRLSGRMLSAARAGRRDGAEHCRRGKGKARLGRRQSEGLRNPVIAIKKEGTLSVIFIADRVLCAFRAFGAHLFLSLLIG